MNLKLNFPRYTSFYDKCFPISNLGWIKGENLNHWTRKGAKMSSKRKQKLYEKFLKNRHVFNETA